MLLIKTEEGQQAFKQRDARMGPRQRSAFLLFDGQRSVDQVLQATAGLGITGGDVAQLQVLGFLQAAAGLAPPGAPAAAPGPVPRSPQQRYRDAYPMALALAGSLGLKGFRLNLAVEAATGVEDLVALLPRLQAATSEARCQPLAQALSDEMP